MTIEETVPANSRPVSKAPYLRELAGSLNQGIFELAGPLNWGSEVKNPPAILLECRRLGFDPWVAKIRWRREWQHTLVFLPGEFQGQRSLAGYSPWAPKESDTTERLTLSLFIHIYVCVCIYIYNILYKRNYHLSSFKVVSNKIYTII